MSEEEQLIKEKIEDLKEYLEYGMSYSEYLDVVNAFEYIENKFKEKDKIIELMARAIDNYDSQLDINTFKNKEHVIEYFTEYATEGE